MSSDDEFKDTICQKCGDFNHADSMLICDGCDNGWHMHCLNPKLSEIPKGKWYCPFCNETPKDRLKRLELMEEENKRLVKEKKVNDEKDEKLYYEKLKLEKE